MLEHSTYVHKQSPAAAPLWPLFFQATFFFYVGHSLTERLWSQGTMPNLGSHTRRLIAVAYRPVWAGPIAPMPLWEPADVARLPETVWPLLLDPNLRTDADFETPNVPIRDLFSSSLGLTFRGL